MTALSVLAISGSLRKDSYNRKMLQIAKAIASEKEAQVKEADLKELALPLYDEDIEAQGFPPNVQQLKKSIEAADLLLVACPEYNYSVSGALKNAIDWVSQGENSLDGKVVAIFGASTNHFGTVRAQSHLRLILTALNAQVLPQPQVFLPIAQSAFTPEGTFIDQQNHDLLQTLIHRAIELTRKLKG